MIELNNADSLHALRGLPCNVYQQIHRELGFIDVEVLVEAGPITPLCDDGEKRLGCAAHEQ